MHKNILAIDYGTKKSGLAYSVEGFSFPWKTVPTADLLRYLPTSIQEKQIHLLVIGMPYNIDGSLSPHARRVKSFAASLEKILSIPIVLHDERLTTSEARIGFAESGYMGDIDAESARLILEDYLSS